MEKSIELDFVEQQIQELELNKIEHLFVPEIVNFLENSHDRFKDHYIPKIEQNFLLLIQSFPHNNNITTLLNLFLKFQIQFKQHIEIEEQTMFPYAKTLYQSSQKNLTSALILHFSEYKAKDFALSHEHTECYLTEIIFMLQQQEEVKHHFIYNILQKQLCQFDSEIRTHAWVEDNVLLKKLVEIEEALELFVTEH